MSSFKITKMAAKDVVAVFLLHTFIKSLKFLKCGVFLNHCSQKLYTKSIIAFNLKKNVSELVGTSIVVPHNY